MLSKIKQGIGMFHSRHFLFQVSQPQGYFSEVELEIMKFCFKQKAFRETNCNFHIIGKEDLAV